jgi:Ca-activated chloride channel family protein
MTLQGITFAHPQFFWLLAVIPVMIAWKVFRGKRMHADLRLPDTRVFGPVRPTLRTRLLHAPFVLRLLSFALLTVALARPQSSSGSRNVNTEGIDIVMAMDVSASMLAEDFRPNRLEASKKVAAEFIKARVNDRIGLVVFSGESFTQAPITTDHSVILNLMSSVRSGLLQDGTAIGEGLATAVNRLKESKAKSKVIILLTDGVNNAGSVAPLTAAEIAKVFNIRVYTIGVGTIGMAPYPVQTPFGIQYQNMEVQIEEGTLKNISGMTQGRYYRATGNSRLQEIYREIDKLEKTRIEVTEYHTRTEEFFPWALAAGILFLLELLLKNTYLKSIT